MKFRFLFIDLLALVLGLFIQLSSSYALTADISTNASDYTAGSLLAIYVSVNNQDQTAVVDAYVAIKLPNQNLLFVQNNSTTGANTFVPGTLLPSTWTPYRQNLSLPMGYSITNLSLLQYLFTGSESSGLYNWYILFTTAGTTDIVSTVGTAPFTFSESGEGTSCGLDQINMEPKIAGSLTNLTWKVTTTCSGPLNGIVCFEGGSESLCSSNILDTPTINSKSVTNLTSSFAVDFLLPSGAKKAKFLYCDSGTLSLTTPHTCSDGSAPKVKSITVNDDTDDTETTDGESEGTWTIVTDTGETATLTVDAYGNFTGTGWTGNASGCDNYNMPISNGLMSGTSMTFKVSASYCSGQGRISGSCKGTLNASFPNGTAASGNCSGSISDPLGARSFTFSWTATNTSGGGGTETNSTMTWRVTDGCNDGQRTYFSFFDSENNLVWPSSSTYWIMTQYNQTYQQTLSCSQGSKVCYGAESENSDKYWGVGITGKGTCSTCCNYCDGQTYSRVLTCS